MQSRSAQPGKDAAAQYEYGSFGELLRATGQMPKVSLFGFSANFTDDESGLLYYGYRYYNPSTGRLDGSVLSIDTRW